eukprot:TRINITY_DN7321_c0_g1_i2.p1 TRINITY_DN7321_c0_g1~~TRINITY_DN7321_c0_g1_i2.p1  ORF type:complete len:191 (-),score=12.41 TRINITY_DN7321_c0_g1_i2:207-779(-)
MEQATQTDTVSRRIVVKNFSWGSQQSQPSLFRKRSSHIHVNCRNAHSKVSKAVKYAAASKIKVNSSNDRGCRRAYSWHKPNESLMEYMNTNIMPKKKSRFERHCHSSQNNSKQIRSVSKLSEDYYSALKTPIFLISTKNKLHMNQKSSLGSRRGIPKLQLRNHKAMAKSVMSGRNSIAHCPKLIENSNKL